MQLSFDEWLENAITESKEYLLEVNGSDYLVARTKYVTLLKVLNKYEQDKSISITRLSTDSTSIT